MNEEFKSVIITRRSVRSYKKDPIPRETIRELLEAAIAAPTAGNSQPWVFGVIDDPKLLKDITSFSPGLFGGPPVIIAACIDMDKARCLGEAGPDVLSRMDVALASENLMLAATACGLGTCMVRSFNITAVSTLLGLPKSIRIETLISLGIPADAPSVSANRKPVDEVTFYNKWEDGGIDG